MAAAVHGLFECWVVADVGRVDVGMFAVGTLFVDRVAVDFEELMYPLYPKNMFVICLI